MINRIERSLRYKLSVPWLANILFFCLLKSLEKGYWLNNLYDSLMGQKLSNDVVTESKNGKGPWVVLLMNVIVEK